VLLEFFGRYIGGIFRMNDQLFIRK